MDNVYGSTEYWNIRNNKGCWCADHEKHEEKEKNKRKEKKEKRKKHRNARPHYGCKACNRK